MRSSAPDILADAQEFIRSLFEQKLPSWSVYHSFDHTREVVEASAEIGKGSKLSKGDMEILLLAAWFHDAGYTETADGHEDISADIAQRFLAARDYPQERIEEVKGCILATVPGTPPENLLHRVLQDADLLHAGRKDFFAKSQLLRIEKEHRERRSYSDLEWLNINFAFLTSNPFRTEYATAEYGRRREKNLLALQENVREAEQEEAGIKEKERRKREKDGVRQERASRPERGIETVFRSVPAHHLSLSSMADHKANIMLSSNSLIISIVFGLLVSKLDTNPHLIIPTFLLLGACLTAIVFAILSTRPKVTRGSFTREDIREKKVNLLFFGNFHSVPLEDFEWAMNEMMNDREYLYGSMIKDLYNLGQVLEKKYRYLRICYNVFMYGLIASVIAFLIAFLTLPTIIE